MTISGVETMFNLTVNIMTISGVETMFNFTVNIMTISGVETMFNFTVKHHDNQWSGDNVYHHRDTSRPSMT
jgi:hypothetical protein